MKRCAGLKTQRGRNAFVIHHHKIDHRDTPVGIRRDHMRRAGQETAKGKAAQRSCLRRLASRCHLRLRDRLVLVVYDHALYDTSAFERPGLSGVRSRLGCVVGMRDAHLRDALRRVDHQVAPVRVGICLSGHEVAAAVQPDRRDACTGNRSSGFVCNGAAQCLRSRQRQQSKIKIVVAGDDVRRPEPAKSG